MFSAATITTKEFLTTLSFDVLVLAVLIAFFFFLGLKAGKTKLIGIVFSTYVAGLLLIAFPFGESISFDLGLLFGKFDVVNLGLLVLFIIVIQVILDYVLELEFDGVTLRKTFQSLILSISAAISFLAVAYMTHVVPATDASASFLDLVFTNPQYLFAALVLPLVGVFLVAR